MEDLSARTETTKVFANPDGTWTSEVASGPVRVRDAQGTWRDVDTTLVADAAGVHPKVAKASLRFSRGGRGALAELGVGGKTLTATLAGLSLPAPTLNGATATYREVTPGVDLTLQARPAGFEFSLVLKQRPKAAPTWKLPLGLAGLRASQDASGGLHFADATGKQVLVADAPMMWDAQTDPATGIGRHHAAVASRLADDGTGGKVLELSPDPAFLSDPAVVYPVTIDPSVVLATSLDTYVESDYTTAQGTATELRAGHINNVDTKTYLDFDTAALTGKHVNSARVDIYQWWASSCTPVTMDVRALTSGYNNSTVWSNRPSESPTIYGQATTGHGAAGTACASGDWVSFPVTGLIQGWADGSIAKYGMTIYADNMGVNGNYARFYSYDNGAGVPKLIVDYNSYPSTPTSLGVSECFGTGCSGTWVTGTTTPVLTASATDPDPGAVLRDDFELWAGNADVPTGSPLATASVPNLSSGALGSWTVPAGILAHGGAYEYRVRAYDGTDIGPWSAWLRFTVDLDAPTVSSVTSSAFGQNSWSPTTTSGTFTFTSPSTDVAGWRYWFDGDAPTDVAAGATYTTPSLSPGAGWHVLHVQALDKGFNRSGELLYAFGNGVAVTAPADGQRTAARVPLAAVAPPGHTEVRFQYRLPGRAPGLTSRSAM